MKTTKNLFLISLISSALIFTSCDKEKAKIDVAFDFDMEGAKLYVDTFSATGDITLGSSVIISTLQKTLDDNNAKIDDVESITLEKVEINMVNPGAQNFNVLSKIYGLMSATGLSEARVAYIDPVPTGVTNISLKSDGANIVEYIKQPQISFRLLGTATGPNTERDTLTAKLFLTVKAKVSPL